MLKLNKSYIKVADVIDDCVANMNRSEWKQHIENSKEEIVKKSYDYDQKAQNGLLSSIVSQDYLQSGATKTDMIKLYDQKFVPMGQNGRKYYDIIKASSPNFICPYCAQREVETLDHYLPKAKYPVFAVTPDNLVPSCTGCNKTKLDKESVTRSKEIIHPYYDDFSNENWIVAEINQGEPIGFIFKVKCPDSWDETKKIRAENHFKQFDLNRIYNNYAAQEFIACFNRIKREYLRGAKELAISRLSEDIEDRNMIHMNTWQAAMYQAIIDSEWFWNVYLPQAIN